MCKWSLVLCTVITTQAPKRLSTKLGSWPSTKLHPSRQIWVSSTNKCLSKLSKWFSSNRGLTNLHISICNRIIRTRSPIRLPRIRQLSRASISTPVPCTRCRCNNRCYSMFTNNSYSCSKTPFSFPTKWCILRTLSSKNKVWILRRIPRISNKLKRFFCNNKPSYSSKCNSNKISQTLRMWFFLKLRLRDKQLFILKAITTSITGTLAI